MSDSGSMNLDLGVNLGVTLDGAGLQELSNTIKEISKGKDLQRYWKDVESATDSAAKAIERYNKNVNSKGLAENLLKQINALKALTKKENLSELFPNMELNLDELVESAKKIVPQINSQFSVDSFSQAFKTFDLLKEKSIDLTEAFRKLADYAELVDQNYGLRKENSQFRDLIGDSDVEEVKSKLLEIKKLRDEASETFKTFLKSSNVVTKTENGYGSFNYDFDDYRFERYFEAIREGSMTAQQAIADFKLQYDYLLRDNENNNSDFGLEQLQAFSNKLDSIFRQVEETSTKINDIISNGVITKSVENLSMDSSLSDSQRSLFGNLLKDEESLKSITALFQKLIEESNKTSKVDLFNDEQLQQVLSIFDKMEGHLSSLRSIISDVGDGEEFSPLLKMINNVQSSISELATSVKGIGLNMNIDVGSDSEMEAKVQSKIANALQAYQRLFDHIKMSSAGGQIITDKFFDFDINQYDTMMGKLQGYKKFIDNMRKEAKAQFNGQDVLYQDTEKSFWTQASSAAGQVTKVFNEMKAASSTNPLADMFSKTDLSEVISQLGLIVAKLEEISTTASSFKNAFANGFNVTASVKEIDKLTNRVKELEDELSKIKLNPVGVDKSNISSENITSAIESQNKIQEELKETQKQAEQTADGIITVYRGLKSSSDEMFDSTHLSAWFSDNLKSANSFAKGIGDVYKSQIKLDNPMIVDAKGANHESILYAETNEELQKAIKLQEELNAKRKEFSEKYGKYLETQDMSLLGNPSEYLKDGDVIDELEQKLSRYLKTTEQLQEIAKNGGYDGLIIKNIKDNYLSSDDNIGTSYAVFDKEKIISYERINYLKELEKQAEQTTKAVQDVSETPIKDVFQDDDKINTDASTTAIKEESRALEQVSTSAKDAATSKEKFANANKEVKASAESSSTSLNEEKKKFENVGDSAEETKKKLDDVVFKPNTEGFDEIVSKLDIAKDKIEEISKITKSSVWSESQGEYLESYNIKYKNGTSEIRGESSNKKGSNVLRANEVAYDAKAEEQAAKERLKSEQKVQAQKDAFHKKNLTAIDLEIQKREEESKMFSSTLKAQMEERQKDISSMESSLKSFNESSKQLSEKPDDQHQFSSWKKQLEDLNIKIAEYKSKVESLSKIDIADEAQINKAKTEIEELGKSIKETITSMKNVPQASRGWNQTGVDKLIQRMNDDLKKNSKYTDETKRNIQGLIDELNNIPDRPLSEIFNDFSRFKREAHDAGKEGKAFFEIFKEKVIYGGAAQLAGMFGFYDVINIGRECITTVRELDTALTEMRKVSDEGLASLKNYQNISFDVADEIGSTALALQDATATWMRLGESLSEASESAKDATILMNVSEFESIDEATDSLVSMSQAFKELDKMEIIDVLDKIGNEYSISTDNLSRALQDSAAVLKTQGNDLYESVALITAGNAINQDYSKTAGETLPERYRNIFYRTYLTARAA